MASSAGRTSRRQRRIKANLRTERGPCWLCGQAIDYSLPYRDPDTGKVNLMSFSPDHYYPVSTHPHLAEDPANQRASHLGCNIQRGTKAAQPGLGSTSQDW